MVRATGDSNLIALHANYSLHHTNLSGCRFQHTALFYVQLYKGTDLVAVLPCLTELTPAAASLVHTIVDGPTIFAAIGGGIKGGCPSHSPTTNHGVFLIGENNHLVGMVQEHGVFP
jgi:hypothetical protein